MWSQVLFRSFLILVASACVTFTINTEENTHVKGNPNQGLVEHLRFKRGFKKPGFFRTLFSVVYEQWADTKDTVNSVRTMLDDNFLDDGVTTTTSAPSNDSNVSTTQAPYKITRSEFNRILRRNLKGLVRLYNLELRDALGQSDRVNEEFKRNLSIEVSKYL